MVKLNTHNIHIHCMRQTNQIRMMEEERKNKHDNEKKTNVVLSEPQQSNIWISFVRKSEDIQKCLKNNK